MDNLAQYHFAAAALFARVFLGFLFLFQGRDAIFNIGMRNVVNTYQNSFENRSVPRFLIVIASWYTSYTEFFCGILLILGLFQYVALYLLAFNLIVAAIGFGLNTALWDTRHVLPRLLLILFLLCIPREWNVFGLDQIIFK